MDKLCCCCDPDLPNITVRLKCTCACCKGHVEENEVDGQDTPDCAMTVEESKKVEEEEEEGKDTTCCCCFRRKRHAKSKRKKCHSRDGAKA